MSDPHWLSSWRHSRGRHSHSRRRRRCGVVVTTHEWCVFCLGLVGVCFFFVHEEEGRRVAPPPPHVRMMVVQASPLTRPYIPYRTSPFDHNASKIADNHRLFVPGTLVGGLPSMPKNNKIISRKARRRDQEGTIKYVPSDSKHQQQCPLSFTIGVSKRAHHVHNSNSYAIVQAPILYPIFPARGAGKQILHTTLHEHLDLLSSEVIPSRSSRGSSGESKKATSTKHNNGKNNNLVQQGLIQHQEFPLLFESSSFAFTTPIIHDVNYDGIPDTILTDYDGGIYIIGLYTAPMTTTTNNKNNNDDDDDDDDDDEDTITAKKRYYHHGQVPRLYVRKDWIETRVNETVKEMNITEESSTTTAPTKSNNNNTSEDEDKEKEAMGDDNYGSFTVHDPYHSYFEYASKIGSQKDNIHRGITANVMGQQHDDLKSLESRRNDIHNEKVKQKKEQERETEKSRQQPPPPPPLDSKIDPNHRRLQEVGNEPTNYNNMNEQQQQQQQQQQQSSVNEQQQQQSQGFLDTNEKEEKQLDVELEKLHQRHTEQRKQELDQLHALNLLAEEEQKKKNAQQQADTTTTTTTTTIEELEKVHTEQRKQELEQLHVQNAVAEEEQKKQNAQQRQADTSTTSTTTTTTDEQQLDAELERLHQRHTEQSKQELEQLHAQNLVAEEEQKKKNEQQQQANTGVTSTTTTTTATTTTAPPTQEDKMKNHWDLELDVIYEKYNINRRMKLDKLHEQQLQEGNEIAAGNGSDDEKEAKTKEVEAKYSEQKIALLARLNEEFLSAENDIREQAEAHHEKLHQEQVDKNWDDFYKNHHAKQEEEHHEMEHQDIDTNMVQEQQVNEEEEEKKKEAGGDENTKKEAVTTFAELQENNQGNSNNELKVNIAATAATKEEEKKKESFFSAMTGDIPKKNEDENHKQRDGDDDDNDYSDYGKFGDDAYRGGDDEYRRNDYDYRSSRYKKNHGYDDHYQGKGEREDWYDEDNYILLNPHILCTPTLAEIPKLYGNAKNEYDDMLFIPVSYYLDEDECEGSTAYKRFDNDHNDEEVDHSDVKRGLYVASAIMVYNVGSDANIRWGRQEHLELSSDYSSDPNITLVGKIPFSQDLTKMGAFAMSSPLIADISKEDSNLDILLGTSMGLLYLFDARTFVQRKNWPIQMPYGIENNIIVEDVVGDTNLEIFVMDIGANIVCFQNDGTKIWDRNLIADKTGLSREESKKATPTLLASSSMTLGDVDGDGVNDIVVTVRFTIRSNRKDSFTILFAMNAATGSHLPNFPIEFDSPSFILEEKIGLINEEMLVHTKLPQPLLVDLHSNQKFLSHYIHRNGTSWGEYKNKDLFYTKPTSSSGGDDTTEDFPGGGIAPGLHIVLPISENLYIIEGGSGCIQNIPMGEDITSMVQVDDVHGTNSLDLVVTTKAGNIVTLEMNDVPYHPLNVWNNGEGTRGRYNTYTHGYSASQGIFLRPVSRQYRDIFGALVPITFEIFDNRPNIQHEPDQRVYHVEVRDGSSSRRVMFRNSYNYTGAFTENFFIPYGPGYYTLHLVLHTTNGHLMYEDIFHIGYNINFLHGFGTMVYAPLLVAALVILVCGVMKGDRTGEDYDDDDRDYFEDSEDEETYNTNLNTMHNLQHSSGSRKFGGMTNLPT